MLLLSIQLMKLSTREYSLENYIVISVNNKWNYVRIRLAACDEDHLFRMSRILEHG